MGRLPSFGINVNVGWDKHLHGTADLLEHSECFPSERQEGNGVTFLVGLTVSLEQSETDVRVGSTFMPNRGVNIWGASFCSLSIKG